MPHPPEYYKNLRDQYTPKKLNVIFLLESPPASGKYFYDTTGEVTEPLYKAMMEYSGINAINKQQGLTEFCAGGHLLVDATYNPVNNIRSKKLKNAKIFENYDGLKSDLVKLGTLENQAPLILIKANIFELFKDRLKREGFNVWNEIKIPFPSNGQQNKFFQRLKEVIIIEDIKRITYLNEKALSLPIPSEYCENRKKVKAIILGADPSNFSDSGKTKLITKVFDLPDGNKLYFRSILTNLSLLGLNLKNIYVQNVVRNYMNCETAKNKNWDEFANYWKPLLLEDLDKIDPERKLPVFATAEIVLKFLLNDKKNQADSAKDYFDKLIYHKPEENYLNRKLFPCFRRHYPIQNTPNTLGSLKSILIKVGQFFKFFKTLIK